MEFLLTLFLLWCIWSFINWLAGGGETTPSKRPKQNQGYSTPQAQPSRYSQPRRPSTRYGAPNSNQPYVLRKPVGECICGCNGVPLTHLPEYSIDYDKYKSCPARLKRKRTGVFINDRGIQEVWSSKTVRRLQNSTPEAKAKRALEVKERARARNEANRLERQKQRDRAEAVRHENQEHALSAGEAERRGLPTYLGKDCVMKHGGIRHTRNGECVECRRADQRLRAAMRRGAYPRDLSYSEKRRIEEIYEECRRRTKETGIDHHVDHIKPLAAGGEHHPDNLQILTAAENLAKGATWNK